MNPRDSTPATASISLHSRSREQGVDRGNRGTEMPAQQRIDVAEQDSRLGKVGHIDDMGLQVEHAHLGKAGAA